MFCGHQILSHHFSLVTKNSCSNLRQLLMALSFSNGTMGSWVSPSSLTPPPFYPISINCSTDCAQHEFKVLFRPKHLYGLKHPCFRTISRSEQSSLCFHKTWGIPQKRSTSTANTLWKSLREMLQEHLNGSSTDWHLPAPVHSHSRLIAPLTTNVRQWLLFSYPHIWADATKSSPYSFFYFLHTSMFVRNCALIRLAQKSSPSEYAAAMHRCWWIRALHKDIYFGILTALQCETAGPFDCLKNSTSAHSPVWPRGPESSNPTAYGLFIAGTRRKKTIRKWKDSWNFASFLYPLARNKW